MRADPPSFFPLDGRTGWRGAAAPLAPERVRVEARGPMRLATWPGGPLALDEPGGSLGRLVLPAGLARGEDGTLYLVTPEPPWLLRRFDACGRRFVTLPALGDEGRGTPEADRDAARRFDDPVAIAAAGKRLYVAERGNRRVQVFDLASLALVHSWTLDEPGDLAADHGSPGYDGRETAVYLLDRSSGRVLRHRPGDDRPEVVIDDGTATGRWTRIAVDRDGLLYLLANVDAAPRLEIYGADGRRRGEALGAGEVRSRFEPPAVGLDHSGRLRFRAEARHGGLPLRAEDGAEGRHGGLPLLDRRGCPVRGEADEPLGPELYEKDGTWWSAPLDSEIYRCPWHRVEIELDDLPPGTEVRVRTSTWEEAEPAVTAWETDYQAVGPLQPPPRANGTESGEASPAADLLAHEFLIHSQPGRFLRLRLELFGDGDRTPVVRGLRVHYPRRSYLEHLPAIYSIEDDSRVFLEGFLSISQTEWDGVERRVAEIARLFDPGAVPPAFLDHLASWLALPLEGSWNVEQKRRLLAAAPSFYPRRGTPDGVAAVVAIYLENMTGIVAGAGSGTPGDGWPVIVEGFRERLRLFLSQERAAGLGPAGAPLWGPAVTGRLQLGSFARAGEARLVSTGDPERDVFHEHAHRFRVFVPAAWVRNPEDETLLCRALDAEKPAHTTYDLCLVEPLFRVGIQSTLGVDSLIGAWPRARLGNGSPEPTKGTPRQRLGLDTVLGAAPAPGSRVGVDTVLI